MAESFGLFDEDLDWLPEINYISIARAENLYRGRGYTKVQTPWVVNKSVTKITAPEGASSVGLDTDYCNGMLNLSASAEQGFLQLVDGGWVPDPMKKYFSTAPCFRDEGRVDNEFTFQYFMKVELFVANALKLNEVIDDAAQVLATIMDTEPQELKQVDTKEGVDIFGVSETGLEVELGSYGIRGCYIEGNPFYWVYGTGLAEPRTELVRKRIIVERSLRE